MMRPTRRDFLRLLLATPIAAAVDFEQLLWTPSPRIVVPALWMPARVSLTIEQINAVTLKVITPSVIDGFFKTTPLYEYLKERQVR